MASCYVSSPSNPACRRLVLVSEPDAAEEATNVYKYPTIPFLSFVLASSPWRSLGCELVSHGGVWDHLGPIVSMATARSLAWRSLGSSRPYRLHGDRLVIIHESLLFVIVDEFLEGSHMVEFGIFWALLSPWPSPGYELFEGSHITTLDIFEPYHLHGVRYGNIVISDLMISKEQGKWQSIVISSYRNLKQNYKELKISTIGPLGSANVLLEGHFTKFACRN
ncbi:hypothetical protein ACMD2_25851, partial [Ananas comosus]